MREIKFRAWDKQNKEMLVVDTMQLLPMPDGEGDINEPWIGFETKGGSGLCPLRLVELMQFTGLKDENGKDIYEGDIITCRATQREVNDEIEKAARVVVEYSKGYFYPFGYNCGWRSSVDDVEIIGNIHENPKLIGG